GWRLYPYHCIVLCVRIERDGFSRAFMKMPRAPPLLRNTNMADINHLLRPDIPPGPAVPDYQPRVIRPRPRLFRAIADHNPFYLLSAACMLAGCLALSNTTTWTPIATSRLVKLIV